MKHQKKAIETNLGTTTVQKFRLTSTSISLLIIAVVSYLIYVLFYLNNPVNVFLALTILCVFLLVLLAKYPALDEKISRALRPVANSVVHQLKKIIAKIIHIHNIESKRNGIIHGLNHEIAKMKEEQTELIKTLFKLEEQLLRRLNYRELQALAHELGISEHTTEENGNRSWRRQKNFDEFVTSILEKILGEPPDYLLDYVGRKNPVLLRDFKQPIEQILNTDNDIEKHIGEREEIKEKIKKAKTAEEMDRIINERKGREPETGLSDLIVQEIKRFKFKVPANQEAHYQYALWGWLKNSFPNVELEQQSGSSRPDIIIENVAIEIKGPTIMEGLQSCPDKAMRYEQHFDKVIFVLFDLDPFAERYYKEWLTGLENRFPNVTVIRK